MKWNHDIKYPKRGGGYRIIKAGNWWVNQDTPVGEPADLWERKPFDGKKLLDITKAIGIYETPH